MIRPILIEIGLFLTPFVLYAAVLVAARVGVLQLSAWPVPHVMGLLIASLVLVIGSFLVLAKFSGAPPGSTYVPAHVEDGKFVPATTQ
ncbi:MAG: DUF6111 family protein [Xanthobacteraceae bacterium]|jgi:hypothetical protein